MKQVWRCLFTPNQGAYELLGIFGGGWGGGCMFFLQRLMSGEPINKWLPSSGCIMNTPTVRYLKTWMAYQVVRINITIIYHHSLHFALAFIFHNPNHSFKGLVTSMEHPVLFFLMVEGFPRLQGRGSNEEIHGSSKKMTEIVWETSRPWRFSFGVP